MSAAKKASQAKKTTGARTTDDAAAQLRRILDVIPRIADGAPHRLDDIERVAGVDPAQLVGDLRSLAGRDDEPAGFVEGVQIYLESDRVQLVTSHFRRPMRITRRELAALDLGLAMLRCERTPAEREAIDRARERLRETMVKLPDEPATDASGDRHADTAAAGDPALLATLRAALKDRRAARITYRGSSSANAEPRDVRPYALAAARGAWYLVAHCERSADVRLFRLDRMQGAEPLDACYEIPASFTLDDWVHDGAAFRAASAASAATLRIRYSPRIARWIAEREAKPLGADGSLTMEHPLADEAWAVRHALQYGADAEVLAPQSVREAIARRLAGIVAETGR